MDALTTTRATGDRVVLEGTLADLGAVEVLALLGRTHQSGTLHVSGPAPGVFSLVDGLISYATDHPRHNLRHLLVGRGLLDEQAWRSAVAADGSELGEALVRVGVDRGALTDLVHEQILDVTSDVAVAGDGRFRFATGRRDSLGPGFHYPTDELLGDVAARLSDWSIVRSLVPGPTSVPRLARRLPAGRREVTVSSADWQLLAMVDGRRTVGDLREELRRPLFGTYRSVAALLQVGAIELVTEPPR